MLSSLVKAVIGLWPLWLWVLSRQIAGNLAQGGPYYRTALAAAPLLLYGLGHMALARNNGQRPSLVLLLALGSVVAGILGFAAEYERWQPYLGQAGYTWGFILRHLDYPLSLVSLTAILAPVLACLSLEWKNILVKRPKNFRISQETTHGSARWLPMPEAQKKLSEGGLVVGEAHIPSERPGFGGRAPLLCFDGRGHLLTISGSGGGKTISVAVPNCLTWQGPLVAHDPKGELARMCARTRRELPAGRQVAILNPGDPETASFNVLGWLDPQNDLVIENARAVASWLGPGEEPKGENAYFYKDAAKLLQTLILHVVSSPGLPSEMRTLLEVRKLITSPHLPLFLRQIHESGDDFCFGVPAQLAGEFVGLINLAPKQWAGIIGHASEMTVWLNTPSLARLVCGAGSGPKFNPQDFVSGELDIFICVPLKTLDSTPEVARLILGALLNTKYEQGAKNSDERTLFLIDEMPRLRKMEILETARDAGRGYGITLWAIVQDLGQLEKHYGEAGRRSWLESSQIKTFFGISDPETATMLADMLGQLTIEVTSTGQSTGRSGKTTDFFGQNTDSRNTNTNLTARALMTADEIMRMAVDKDGVPDEQLVFLRGSAPLKCGMAKWYRRPEWASLVDHKQPER